MPNEPTIVHRPVIWDKVHSDEYVIDFVWWSTHAYLSVPRWLTLRKEGLKMLSIEYYGMGPPPALEPIKLLSLVQRAKHSNFSSCWKCTKSKNTWLLYRWHPPALRCFVTRPTPRGLAPSCSSLTRGHLLTGATRTVCLPMASRSVPSAMHTCKRYTQTHKRDMSEI